jgi:hypothetical protein
MSINPSGTSPVITADFGGNDFGQCTLFFKPKGGSFDRIARFDNENISGFTFTLDPKKLLSQQKSLADLVGCEISWTVTFIDFEEKSGSEYSFDLAIKQDGLDLLSPPFFQRGSIPQDTMAKTLGGKYQF